jgi:hypothetical protein
MQCRKVLNVAIVAQHILLAVPQLHQVEYQFDLEIFAPNSS